MGFFRVVVAVVGRVASRNLHREASLIVMLVASRTPHTQKQQAPSDSCSGQPATDAYDSRSWQLRPSMVVQKPGFFWRRPCGLTQSGSHHSAAAAARAALSSCCFLTTSASRAVRFAASSAYAHVAAIFVCVFDCSFSPSGWAQLVGTSGTASLVAGKRCHRPLTDGRRPCQTRHAASDPRGGQHAHVVGEDALVALPDEGGELADRLVVVPPQRLAPLVVLVLDKPPHLAHVMKGTYT